MKVLEVQDVEEMVEVSFELMLLLNDSILHDLTIHFIFTSLNLPSVLGVTPCVSLSGLQPRLVR